MPRPQSDTEDFIVVDSSPAPPPPQPKPTPKKPTVAAAKISAGKKIQIKPDILPNEFRDTPPKKKRGRPPKIRPFNDEFRPFNEEFLPAPAPKKQKTTKTEAAYVYNGPPTYLLDPNRKDVFADPGRVKVEEDGTVWPIDGSRTSNFKPVEKVLHEPGHSESGFLGSSGPDIRPASPASPPPPPVKPNNHRYLHINEPVYLGADPRRYRKTSPKTPTPPRKVGPWPDPPSNSVSRGTDAPGITDLRLKYDAKYIPNGLRIPTPQAVEKTKSVERAALGNGGYDEFAPLPNAVRGFATSFERSTGGVVNAGAQTTDKEGRAGWVPWEK